MNYTIGLDIGGTNTDAVLIDQDKRLITGVKIQTSSEGVEEAIRSLLLKTKVTPQTIKRIFLGTTQATNALLERKDLYKVGIVRIAGQKPQVYPSCYLWPDDLRKAVLAGSVTIDGGFQCNGKPITPFSSAQAAFAIQQLVDLGSESIAVVGVFSPLNNEHEQAVAQLVQGIPVSRSSDVGGVGFIERENSTVLNAALKKVIKTGLSSLKSICHSLDLTCPLFITQNDGSLITIEQAMEYPVLTISAGPTNSFRGGAMLAGMEDAIVVDIGGTSTDIGLISKGVPRSSLNTSMIGGIRLNFPMPDVVSIGLGGGSLITINEQGYHMGPHSVGNNLTNLAQSFGGNKLTLTDAAIVAGYSSIKGAQRQSIRIFPYQGKEIIKQSFHKVEKLIQVMKAGKKHPVIFVGGGSALFSLDAKEQGYIFPENFEIANAYGAALSEISGVVDRVVNSRHSILKKMEEEAIEEAVKNGADRQFVRVINQTIIPYHYVPNSMARVVIRASGPLK